MAKFTTDYVNLIASNLRDRYRSGFPILKELVQNADDAGATRLAFGCHPGFSSGADHMLLQGPGFWILNNGRFEPSDRQAIHSFGLNAKAANSGVIGKFGLGMKSVFHLCESFFYVASDGQELYQEILNPWLQDAGSSPMHQQWDHITERDLACLRGVAAAQPEIREWASWFLLWVPLRRHDHVASLDGFKTAAIIDHFPGEVGAERLDFLTDPDTDQRIGALLPLLRNLEKVRFDGSETARHFHVHLQLGAGSSRLDHATDDVRMVGLVSDDRPSDENFRFLARQFATRGQDSLLKLMDAPSWPKSMAIVEGGKRGQVADKARPEGAVLIGHADKRIGRLVVQWAVFLPTEEVRFTYVARIPDSSREYRIVLHGQFFVDAGRRGIEEMDVLHHPSGAVPAGAPQSVVLRSWNQALAQEVVLPRLLQALSEYVEVHGLKDDEIRALTRAIQDCEPSGMEGRGLSFYKAFKSHMCRARGWVRRLDRRGGAWELVEPSASRLLPIPAPANRDHDRPWRVLPGLSALGAVIFVDSAAPCLVDALDNWDDATMLRVLATANAQTLSSRTDLEYLVQFLEMEAPRALQTGVIQDALVQMLRDGLRRVPLVDVRANRALFKRLAALLLPERRYSLGTREVSSKGALPDRAYNELVGRPTAALLLPGDLAPDGPSGRASDSDLDHWFRGLAAAMGGNTEQAHPDLEAILVVADTLIKTAGDAQEQAALLRRNSTLRVLKAMNGRDVKGVAVSLAELDNHHRQRRLFKVSNPNKPLGLVADLCSALPELDVFVVRAPVALYVQSSEFTRTNVGVPTHEDPAAILSAAGAAVVAPILGNAEARRRLLAMGGNADLADTFTVRGLRYLLHGSADHYLDNAVLWKDPSGINSPWVKLWRMVGEFTWSVLPLDLCAAIPDKCSTALRIHTVDEGTIFARLAVCQDFSRVHAESFSDHERDLLLGRLEDETAWRRLPLHLEVRGGYGPATGPCYLGDTPALPVGVAPGMRFIRPSRDEAHRRNQLKWITAWTPMTAAAAVLSSSNPSAHWHFLLNQLEVDLALQDQPFGEWKSVAWLPMKNERFISLENLIDLQGMQADITALARACEFSYAGVADLADEVHRHNAFPKLRAQVASGRKALPILGQLMSNAGLSVGCALAHLDLGQGKYLSMLSRLVSLPAWPMLARVAESIGEEGVPELMVKIAKQLPPGRVQLVLEEIQGWGATRAHDLFLEYLKELRTSGSSAEIRECLAEMSLPSIAGSWHAAGTLVVGVSGVGPERVLDSRVAEILADFVVTNSSVDRQAAEYARPELESGDGASLVQLLEVAFEPLRDSCAQPAVGAVIGLFGDAAREMAQAWIGDISFEDYLDYLGWIDPGRESGLDGRLKWMGGKSVQQALASLKPMLKVVTGETVKALSILGVPVEVSLLPVTEAATLLAGKMWWLTGNGVVVSVRPPASLLDLDVAEQKAILQRTAEELLDLLYNQPHADLGRLWTLFENADQVTLDVAERMILDGLPQSLRQLGGASKNTLIAAALAEMDQARRDLASAHNAKRGVAAPQANVDRALDNLARLVLTDVHVQAALLAGIRERVSQNQYERDSIPFELFQNADDAVSEYQQLRVAEGRAELDGNVIGRFVLQGDRELLRCMHWGRPINYSGRNASFRPDFANDLERMLMLGASSKSGSDDVTGKFGLGFKSVLLASDRPRIWSGDLCFEVLAGCLPQRWVVSPDSRRFHQAHQLQGTRALRSTLVELPLNDTGTSEGFTERFSALAGLITVFSRHIKQVSVNEQVHSWNPQLLLESGPGRIESGWVQLPAKNGSMASRLLVLRAGASAVALRLDSTGVIGFDHAAPLAAPAVWVTAPTRGTAARGGLINAGFQIDTGRASLALGKTAARNRALAGALADELSAVVAKLQRRAEEDWPALSAELGCSQQESGAHFWFGLWKVLFSQDPSQDAAEDVLLVEEFVARLFSRVVAITGKIATGMPGGEGSFAGVDQLNLSIRLDRLAGVAPALREWPAFAATYPAAGWCAEELPEWLKRSGVLDDVSSIVKLDQATILEAVPSGRLGPGHVGNVAKIMAAWPRGTLEDTAWAGLGSMVLRTRAGSWSSARTVLHGESPDHLLLATFAPKSTLLDEAYEFQAGSWDAVCVHLPHFKADAGLVAGWCACAIDHNARLGVLHWLVRNPYHPVMALVQNGVHDGGWLGELDLDHELLTGFPVEDRRSLLAKLGLLCDEASEDIPLLESERLDLPTIARWWKARRLALLETYDRKLWPASVDRGLLSANPFDRSAWMTLFSLAVFRRYGRVTDEQHRGFLDFLHAQGWWDTICHLSPSAAPGAWMDILENYAARQMTTPLFEQWMDSFPRLYRIARWLGEYVHLFQTLDLRRPDEVAELLTPAGDASLSGSEIEAPTLSGMLRLGRNLVVRELLREGVLVSGLAQSLAYMPRSSVLELMEDMGFQDLQGSQQIHRVLVEELGSDGARFEGDYDIPLQLLATSERLRLEVLSWAQGEEWENDEAELIEEASA